MIIIYLCPKIPPLCPKLVYHFNIAEDNYEKAYEYIKLAEKWLPYSDKKMAAIVNLNKSDIFNHFNMMEQAVKAYETCADEYDGFTYLPEDMLICGVSLYYHLGDRKKYDEYINRLLEAIGSMYASEFIDAGEVIFECSLDSCDYALVEKVIGRMDSYMAEHPNESKVGLKIEQLKYIYAKKINDTERALAALERKNYYYDIVVSDLEKQRIVSLEEYYETHEHLQEAIANEVKANHAKTLFLANMSHDIRTPMNAIVGFTNLMEHALDSPEKLTDYLAKIRLSSRHMLGLINDLLDMSKIESGTAKLNAEPMKLADQITQIQDIVRIQVAQRKQSFEIETRHICHENLIGDPVRLRQIILNVLSNSVKYTKRGGSIKLYIEERNTAKEGRADYIFRISDDGMGIAPELLEHIFDPFVRGEESVVNKIQGTGLGMTITKNIVELMGGTISIASKPDEGTVVEIQVGFDIDTAEDSKLEPIRLLVISDDQGFIQELYYSALNKPVYLKCASGADKATALLKDEPAEAVILCDAFCKPELVMTLRKECRQETILLALDNQDNSIDFKELKESGINGFLSWPFFFTDLEKEVNRLRSDGGMPEKSVLNGMRFLCAEDNELNAEILQASLEIAGASSVVYPDGKKLVEAFETEDMSGFDAILMDIQMPNMNGYEATRRIRQSNKSLGRAIPIIAMTANAFIDDVNASYASGMNAHISKPLDMAVLESTMRRIKGRT